MYPLLEVANADAERKVIVGVAVWASQYGVRSGDLRRIRTVGFRERTVSGRLRNRASRCGQALIPGARAEVHSRSDHRQHPPSEATACGVALPVPPYMRPQLDPVSEARQSVSHCLAQGVGRDDHSVNGRIKLKLPWELERRQARHHDSEIIGTELNRDDTEVEGVDLG